MLKLHKYLFAVALTLSLLLFGCQKQSDDQANTKTPSGSKQKGLIVQNPRCEYLVNPSGIDVPAPRLYWVVNSGQRGQKQTAYRVLVATSKERLAANVGDLWDTGKITSDQTAHVEYKGKKLTSRMQCYWKVMSWDKDDIASTWSETASWTMGLLNVGDWKGQWIGYDGPIPQSHVPVRQKESVLLEGCKWTWFPQGNPQESAPVGTCCFRRKITIDPQRKIKQGRFFLCVDNNLTLFVNGKEMGQVEGWMPIGTLDVTETLTPGDNILAIAASNVGNGDNPAGLFGKLVIDFEEADEQVVPVNSTWKVTQAEQEGWRALDFDESKWVAAHEFMPLGGGPWGNLGQDPLNLPPPSYLRKAFVLNKPIQRATIYGSALGLYELHVNGQRVGDDYFTPGWTEYSKRVYYNSYEVTNLLQKGKNALGVILADGWYSGHIGWGHKRDHYGDKPRVLVQLEVQYTDGTTQTIVTDDTWKTGYGPHVEADFLMGETYDARLEQTDWNKSGFDDSAWQPVAATKSVDIEVQAYPGVTVKNTVQIKPVKITEIQKGVYIFDLGQNIAGWAQLKVKGQPGDKVVMRFAEVLNPDGTLYTENLRGARCIDTYICKGVGEEIWQPHFTYHGFRYIEVTGYPGKPTKDTITGMVIHSDTPVVGQWECSDNMVNQLYKNIIWGQRGNFVEVPTDCPQRDERLGWTGDAQIFVRTSTYNMDVAAFFTKWFVDLQDAQGDDGNFPDVAPRIVATGGGTAAWGDAGVICPWTIYRVYDDKRVIEKHYDAMQKWIGYLQANSKNLLRPAAGYGDWVSIGSDTPKDVIATAYFAYSTRLLAQMAAAVGRNEDAKKYEELFQQIKTAFNEAFVDDDGVIKGNTQTCYLLGLHFDLLPDSKRPLATRHLMERVKAKNYHLSTGFVGLSCLLPVLSENGHLDIAYRLLENDTFPSWGYSIKNGATTIWERWDGWTEEKGFQTPGMNSFNHYSFGSVGRWLFDTVAGIDTESAGFKRIIIHPQPGGSLTYTKASFNSIHGPITTDWKLQDNKFTLAVTIPANTTATVYIPSDNPDTVFEGNNPATQAEGVKFLRTEKTVSLFQITSGSYSFSCQKD